MPPYRKRKRTFRKKPYTKRARRPYRSIIKRNRFAGVPSGMPKQRRAFLRYCEQINITSTAGALATNVFRANGVFDPNHTGIGHQPMGFDQWAGLFNHYIVVGSKISIAMTSADTSNTNPSVFGVYLTDSTTVPYTDWTEFKEAKKGSQRTVQGGRTSTPRCGTKFSAKKFYNVTDIKDNVARLGASITATPSEQALYCVYYQLINLQTITQSFTVTIDYIVDFSEPRDLAQS